MPRTPGLLPCSPGKVRATSKVSRGEVRLNLAEVVEQVRTRLIDDGFTLARRIPTVDASITIYSSSDIDSAQEAFRWLERAARVLPVLAAVAAIGAVVVARVRRRALLAVGLRLVVGMVALAVTLRVLRAQYLDELPAGVPNDVAEIVFDAVVAYIRTALRVVGLAGAGLALVGLLARPAARWRTRLSRTSEPSRMVALGRDDVAVAVMDDEHLTGCERLRKIDAEGVGHVREDRPVCDGDGRGGSVE